MRTIDGGHFKVNMRRFLLSMGLLGSVFLAACQANSNGGPEGETQRVATAEQRPIEVVVSGTGRIEPEAQAFLSFAAGGNMGEVHVSVGETVNQETVLMELDLGSVDPSLISAEADLIQARQQLDELFDDNNQQVRLAEAERALAQAKDALEDAEYLRRVRQEGNRASESTIDTARAQVVIAQDVLNAAKARYDRQSGRPEDSVSRALALTRYASAIEERDAAQRSLNWYLGRPTEIQQAELDADVAVAEANLAKAQETVDTLKQGPDPDQVAAAQARLRSAEARFRQSRIEAPFEGTVLAVNYAVGDSVTPGQTAVVLADLSQLHVETSVDELDIASVEEGQSVSISLDALPEVELEGEVAEIDLAPGGTGASTEYPVRVALTSIDPRARVGMTVAIDITIAGKADALIIPNWALRFDADAGDVYVTIQGPSGLERRLVELGLRNELFSEVVGGLDPGDVVTISVTPQAPSFSGPFGGG
jgi:RND family efflux transporter MFP subunit